MKYCTLVDSGTGGQREEEGAVEMEHYDSPSTPFPIPLCHWQAGRSIRNKEADPDKKE